MEFFGRGNRCIDVDLVPFLITILLSGANIGCHWPLLILREIKIDRSILASHQHLVRVVDLNLIAGEHYVLRVEAMGVVLSTAVSIVSLYLHVWSVRRLAACSRGMGKQLIYSVVFVIIV